MAYTNNRQARCPHHNRGFTLVELLVVIGIIALLVSILVPVVNRARIAAQAASVKQQLNRISGAISAYYMDYKAYPGYLPNSAFATNGVTTNQGPGTWKITQTEDMTMSIIGGWTRVPAPGGPDINMNNVFKGPHNINAANFSRREPFLNPSPNELSPSGNLQWKLPTLFPTAFTDSNAPEFVDLFTTHSWKPRPIIYMRANQGATAVDVAVGGTSVSVSKDYKPAVQYNLVVLKPYLAPMGTTKEYLEKQKALVDAASNDEKSVVVGYFTNPSANASVIHRDGYILISAGADGVFGTGDDIKLGSGGAQ